MVAYVRVVVVLIRVRHLWCILTRSLQRRTCVVRRTVVIAVALVVVLTVAVVVVVLQDGFGVFADAGTAVSAGRMRAARTTRARMRPYRQAIRKP